jgi:glycosyltransferase involved in cell wall biosynthesis
VELEIVGGGESHPLQRLTDAGVRLIGSVADVRPYYERAHCVIAPLRAGGGTRIKILEAFSYGRPVVATAIGVEGIEAIAGEHLLCGDTPAEFAQHCLRVLGDPELSQHLCANALTLLRASYSRETLRRALAVPP